MANYGVGPVVPAIVAPAASTVTLTAVGSFQESIAMLERMKTVKWDRVNAEFVAQVEPQKRGELAMEKLDAENTTYKAILKAIKTLERMKEFGAAYDARKPENIVAVAVAATEAE